MAIRTFNSVGGFSVGEIPETIILANGDITTDFATFTSNVAAGNVKTDNLLYANGQPWDFQLPAGTDTQIQYYDNGQFGASSNLTFNATTQVLTVAGNVAATKVKTDSLLYANGLPWDFTLPGGGNTQIQFNDGPGDLGGSSAFTFDKTSNTLTLTGDANFANVTTTGEIQSLGNVTAPWFYGNVVGKISGDIIIPGTSTGVVINDSGNANAFGGFTFNKSTNAVSITGNLTAGNVAGGNLVSASYLEGTLTTSSAAQPNITSVGTLVSLTVTGTVDAGDLTTGGNLSVGGRVLTNLVPVSNDTKNLGSSAYAWKNVYTSGNIVLADNTTMYGQSGVLYTTALHTDNDANVSGLTVRSDASVTGNIVIGGNLTVNGTTTYVNVDSMDITDPLISLGGAGAGGNAAAYDGKDRGLYLRNYKSDGSAAVNQFVGWDTSASEFVFGSNVSESGDVITVNTYGNIRAGTIFGNIQGTINTTSQTTITELGTLQYLNVSGDANIGGLANVNTLVASGLSYPTVDGSAAQVLSTNGSGSLYWATIDTYKIANGTSNVNVETNGNVNVVVAGSAVTTFTSASVDVSTDLNVTGNATVGTLKIGNSVVRSATVTTATTSQRTLVSLTGSTFRVAEFFVKGEDTTGGKYSVATVSMVHDATSAEWSTYGTVNIPYNSSTGALNVTYASGIASLVVTPSSSNNTTWTVQYRTM